MKTLLLIHLFYGSQFYIPKKNIISIKRDFCQKEFKNNYGFPKIKAVNCVRINAKNGNFYLIKDKMQKIKKELK